MVQILPRYRDERSELALRAGSALGEAVGTYFSEKSKREKESQVSEELNKALSEEGGLREGMTDLELARHIGKQRPEVAERLTDILRNTRTGATGRLAPESLFAGILRKNLGSNPSREDVARGEQILHAGAQLLQQGASPLQAYDQARNLVDEEIKAKKKADKQLKSLKGKSFFGSNEKEDAEKIARLRKSKILSDDEIAAALVGLGYDADDVESRFGVRLSPEMADELGFTKPEEEDPAQPQIQDQGMSQAQQSLMQQSQTQPQRVKWNPQDPAHQQRALQILQEAKGDRARANQILAQEFER